MTKAEIKGTAKEVADRVYAEADCDGSGCQHSVADGARQCGRAPHREVHGIMWCGIHAAKVEKLNGKAGGRDGEAEAGGEEGARGEPGPERPVGPGEGDEAVRGAAGPEDEEDPLSTRARRRKERQAKKAKKAAPKKAKPPSKKKAEPPRPLSRAERLDAEMARIEKEMKGSISLRKASDRTYAYNVRRPTGILGLDIGLGGGFPAGSVNQLYGADGSGKNLVMNYVIREVQRNYGDDAAVLYVPLEYGYDKVFAWHCGVACPLTDTEFDQYMEDGDGGASDEQVEMVRREVGRFYLADLGQKGTTIAAEAKFEAAIESLQTGLYQLICIDGLGAFLGKDQRFKGEGKRRRLQDSRKVGVNARLLTDFLGEAFSILGMPDEDGGPNQTTVILNSQQRANIVDNPYAAKFAKKVKPVDSRALLHAKAMDVELKKIKALKREIRGRKKLVGRLTGWEVIKGKLGTHEGHEGEFEHYFSTGINVVPEAVATARALSVIVSRGAKVYGPWGDKGKTKDGVEEYYDEGSEQDERLEVLRRACFRKAGLNVRFSA
jgi:RecA/RadA recombinase